MVSADLLQCFLINKYFTNSSSTDNECHVACSLSSDILPLCTCIFGVLARIACVVLSICNKCEVYSWKSICISFFVTSFSHHMVCPSLCVCLSVLKLFTFSSSPEALGQFQSNLASLGKGDSSLFILKATTFSQGKIITK